MDSVTVRHGCVCEQCSMQSERVDARHARDDFVRQPMCKVYGMQDLICVNACYARCCALARTAIAGVGLP